MNYIVSAIGMTAASVAILIGALLGAMFGRPIDEFASSVRYSMFPVIEAKWTVEPMHEGFFAVRFSGYKYRDDCELVAIWVYDVSPDGVKTRLTVSRPNGTLNRRLGAGPFSSRYPWVITPPPVGRLEISFEHRCDGHSVSTVVGEA